MSTPTYTRSAGFTLIELMVVVALVAIVITLAVPSFREIIARNRLEGVAGEFFTDLQYTRSEAVARNANVGLEIGASQTCYTIYQESNPAAGSCDCTATPVCTGGPTAIKTVSFAGTNVSTNAGPLTFLFEPLRGGNSGAASVALGTSIGANTWQLQAEVTPVGRVKTCSPSGAFKGYPSC